MKISSVRYPNGKFTVLVVDGQIYPNVELWRLNLNKVVEFDLDNELTVSVEEWKEFTEQYKAGGGESNADRYFRNKR